MRVSGPLIIILALFFIAVSCSVGKIAHKVEKSVAQKILNSRKMSFEEELQ